MNSSYTVVYMAFIITFAVTTAAEYPCTQEEMLKCYLAVNVITDNRELSFITNKQELDLQCPQLREGLMCIDNFTQRCMKPEDRAQFMTLHNGAKEFIYDLCRDGSYQTEFLKHAPCMREVRVDVNSEHCTREHQVKLRLMNHAKANDSTETSEIDRENHMRTICCSFQKYVDCSLDVIERRCGVDSAEFTSHIFARMGNPFNQNHCRKYSKREDCDFGSGSWWSSRAHVNLVGLAVGLNLVIRLFLS